MMARVLLQCVLAMALVQTLWALAPVRCRTQSLRFSRRVSVVSAAPGERSPADLAYESEQLSLFNSALSQLTKREGTVSVPASPLISSGTAAWSPSVADVDNSVPKSTFTPPKPVGAHAGKIKLKDPPVFFFGDGVRHAALANKDTKTLKNLLGGKGAALADMGFMGLSVPPGFTITTETCAAYHSLGGTALPEGVWEEILLNVRSLEKSVNKRLGSTQSPLLVSVRSGAAISMPGMMDTVLNLGLNDESVVGLARSFNDERFAYDSYRRLLQMFGTVVLEMPHHAFEKEMTAIKANAGAKLDTDLTVDHLKELVRVFKKVYADHGKVFPVDPYEQLYMAINAVFNSWNSERAIKYREAEGITGLLGTAVTAQLMVFGNADATSGTGVCFTRNPNTGEHILYGEYLEAAQGEDVVAGIRTPLDINTLQKVNPGAYNQLMSNIRLLESHYGDMQDIEFTVEKGRLYMLQTRSGKRTGAAAIKIAIDLVLEGLATIDQAIMTVRPDHLKQLLHPQFTDTTSPAYTSVVVAKGLAASPGAAVGKIVLTPEAAEVAHASGIPSILVRDDTSPEDVAGMFAAEGILTATGGFTSHASVVARGWGKPCVCGCADLSIDEEHKTISFANGPTLKEGDWVSINGETGEVLVGKQVLVPPSFKDNRELVIFMAWVDARRKMRVLANADTPEDALEARRNGAQGIGLTRTEHMFFADDRISHVRQMILGDKDRRTAALKELLVFQRKDFEGILEAMDGLPVTVRLLDPPLHEFLPRIHPEDKVALSSTESVVDESFAKQMGMSREEVIHAIQRLQEVNPMLGLRGCRLGITIPELTTMQVTALVEAALNNKRKGLSPRIEIMVPLISSAAEFSSQRKLIVAAAEKVFEAYGERIDMRIGTMIEVPRAALTAHEIAAAGADFFSYGTNDLTQMTLGFSRDDAGSWLPTYIKQGLLEADPFTTIDQKGVGKLIETSIAQGQLGAATIANNKFKVGVCGEHGGDPVSVKFFHRQGHQYVSCSPFRVPLARLAAAQAVIETEAAKTEEKH